MRGASYVAKERTLYAVTAAGAIVGTRTTARVYTHAVVIPDRATGQPTVLSWHLGERNAAKKRAAWNADEVASRKDRLQLVLELARVVEAPAGREALERVLDAVRRGELETPPEPGTPDHLRANRDEARGRGLTAL